MSKISNYDARHKIEARQEFDTHTGSFWGRNVRWAPSRGYLPKGEFERGLSEASYVVLSYSTPIGWYVPGKGWYAPPVTYSTTTAKHQSILRWAIGKDYAVDAPRDAWHYGLTKRQGDVLTGLWLRGSLTSAELSHFAKRTVNALVSAGVAKLEGDALVLAI